MKDFNIDKVPHDLNEAVEMIVSSLTPDEIEILQTDDNAVIVSHHTLGQGLRNGWSLWDKNTHLCQWFRTNLKIGHADDISAIILEAVQARVRGVTYDPQPTIQYFHEHWAKYDCNEFGEKNKL